jgi:hypothetical protein
MNANTTAMRLQVLSQTQQARALKALERKQRLKDKEAGINSSSAVADRLSYHRRVRLAKEARASCLLLAFYKGRSYKEVEQNLSSSKMSPDKLVVMYYPDLARNINFLHWANPTTYPVWLMPQ